MTSSSADWTLAGARLISSASSRLPKTGPSSVSNAPVSGADARADEIRRDEVGRELDAAEAAAENAASVLTVSVLARPGDALQQDVPAGEQRDEHALEHRVLADDDTLALVEHLLERGGGLHRGVAVGGESGGTSDEPDGTRLMGVGSWLSVIAW